MPNRIIKESIRTSDSLDRLSWFEEVLFYRLIVSCDDYGRFDGRAAIIKNTLFPLKENVTLQAVTSAINSLASAELVVLYEFEGKPYLYLPGWNEHQSVRAKKSKFPAPESNVQAHESICKQMKSNASKCSRNPIQSESNPNPNPESLSESARARKNPTTTQRSQAVDAYMRLISPTPSSSSMRELLAFEREIGTECCLRAIDAALDANAPNWHYIRQVLEDKKAQGVKSIEDWDRLDAKRMDSRRRKTQQRAQEAAAPEIDTSDTDRLWEKLRGKAEGGEL